MFVDRPHQRGQQEAGNRAAYFDLQQTKPAAWRNDREEGDIDQHTVKRPTNQLLDPERRQGGLQFVEGKHFHQHSFIKSAAVFAKECP